MSQYLHNDYPIHPNSFSQEHKHLPVDERKVHLGNMKKVNEPKVKNVIQG